ncbi:hypothetical protein [Paraburkholderia sp. 2C]
MTDVACLIGTTAENLTVQRTPMLDACLATSLLRVTGRNTAQKRAVIGLALSRALRVRVSPGIAWYRLVIPGNHDIDFAMLSSVDETGSHKNKTP